MTKYDGKDIDAPDFRKVMEKANLILLSSNTINCFPYKVKQLLKEKTKIKLCTFEKSLNEFGIDQELFGSSDANLMLFNDMFILFYNGKVSKNRIRFSLLHEYGHYELEHNLTCEDMYDLYEVEANFFAAQLLMPEQLINELRKRGKQITTTNLKYWFNVSEEAAKKRIETLRKIDLTKLTEEQKDIDKLILIKYSKFLDSIAPKNDYIYDVDEELDKQRVRDSWLYKGGDY